MTLPIKNEDIDANIPEDSYTMATTKTDTKKKPSSISCEIRQSPVHGRGVFTTRPVKTGENLCIYDGEWKQDIGFHEYAYLKDGKALIGHAEPKNAVGIAQIINDGARVHDYSGTYKDIIMRTLVYLRKSCDRTNVMMREIGSMVVAVAIRDIPTDTELFHPYGTSYWLNSKFAGDCSSEMLKAHACFVHVDELMIPVIRTMMKNQMIMADAARREGTSIMYQLHLMTVDLSIKKIAVSLERLNITLVGDHKYNIDMSGTGNPELSDREMFIRKLLHLEKYGLLDKPNR